MAFIVWQNVLDVAGVDLTTWVTPAQQTLAVNFANERVNVSVFGGEDSTTTLLARSFLAAHFALIFKQGQNTRGALQSRSEGGASTSFATLLTPDPRLLALTVYGRQYLALVQVSPKARAGLVTGRRG